MLSDHNEHEISCHIHDNIYCETISLQNRISKYTTLEESSKAFRSEALFSKQEQEEKELKNKREMQKHVMGKLDKDLSKRMSEVTTKKSMFASIQN